MPREVNIHCGPFRKALKLTATQEKHLGEASPLAILSGPPGCGKSLLLMLKGLEWMKAGHDVIVFGLHADSVPGCRLVYRYLSEAYIESQGGLVAQERTWGEVRWEYMMLRDARNLDVTLNSLLKHGRKLFVLMDDFSPDDGFSVEMMLVFMRELRARAGRDLHLWATNFHSKLPEAFSLLMLNEPLRYPIPVMLEVRLGLDVMIGAELLPATHGFSQEGSSATEDFPGVIHVRHSGSGEQKWPLNSEKCGKQVARLLRDIGVGSFAGFEDRYEFRDVLIISRSSVDITQPPPAFVRGLEACGIPTEICGRRTEGGTIGVEEALDRVILAKENKVTLMHHTDCRGLDRRVVVCLTGASGPEEDYQLNAQAVRELEQRLKSSVTLTHHDPSGRMTQSATVTSQATKTGLRKAKKTVEHQLKAMMELKHRLQIWSRASHQLIVVHLPKGMEGGPSGSENYGGDRKCVIL